VDPESVRELIARPEVRLVSVTWVPTNSGLIQPVEAVGEICKAAGVPYLIDACQAIGHIPINMARLHCDFLSATARKFMRGPRGIGFLYVSDRALERGLYPLLVDMRGAKWVEADTFELVDDARRFENWEFAYALVLGMGEAARYAAAVGVEEGGRRARELAAHARTMLSAIPGLRVLDRGATLAAIVTVEVKGYHAGEMMERLRQRGINTSASHREYAVIDMDEKRAVSALRISPHYYNTTDELENLVGALAEIAGK
jgi:selenocysteine lyase/cysteine desulfurase